MSDQPATLSSTDQTQPPLTHTQKLAKCRSEGHYVDWRTCWNCNGEVMVDHDCGEDCCCCLDPEPNVMCDICEGEAGWDVCFTCHPEAHDD